MYNNRKRNLGGLPVLKKSSSLVAGSHNDNEPPFKRILISSLLGVAINIIAGLILLTVACLIAYSSEDPLSLVPYVALAALLPSNFLGGFFSSKKTSEAPFACGIVTAAAWTLFSFSASLCLFALSSSNYQLWQTLLLHCSSALFCILGALAGGIKRKPSHKKKRFG